MERIANRTSEQLARANCSGTRLETYCIAATPRVSRLTHATRACAARRRAHGARDLRSARRCNNGTH
eukprot:11210812-Lingulodinium_polyedra.AAC.1